MELTNEPGLGTAETVPAEDRYSIQERAKLLRDRAEQLRAMSEGMDLVAARKSIGQIAAAFEKLASQVERRAGQSIKQPD